MPKTLEGSSRHFAKGSGHRVHRRERHRSRIPLPRITARTRAWFVAELVQLKVDILVSSSTGELRAAKEATKTIPIVMITSQDPVATGMVESLAHPGGNSTGVTRLTHELSGKRLELFKESSPRSHASESSREQDRQVCRHTSPRRTPLRSPLTCSR